MTSEEDICKWLKDKVKEEVSAAAEYRSKAKELDIERFGTREKNITRVDLFYAMDKISDQQEEHAKILAELKEELCPGDDPEPGSPDVEKAVEAFDGKGRKVLISLLRDGSLTICSRHDEKTEEGDCYSMDPSPANRQLFHVAQAHYSGMGMKIRTLADD